MAICTVCGAWLEPSALDFSSNPNAIVCPNCGHRERLIRHPLWFIAGSSGSGKSTLMPYLRRALPECVVFEGEAIDFWRYGDSPTGYAALHNQWLKVAHQIALGERPVVFVAIAYPQQLAACPFHHYFSPLHFLGLTCSEQAQRERLLARPAWRNAGSPEFIAQSYGFTRGLEALARAGNTGIALHDTTALTPADSATAIAGWVRQTLSPNVTLHYARIVGLDLAEAHATADPARSLKTRG